MPKLVYKKYKIHMQYHAWPPFKNMKSHNGEGWVTNGHFKVLAAAIS